MAGTTLTDTTLTDTTPGQIDSRRAQQLLERALATSERGDVQSAILSCRQAIALNPTAPQGYSMLGLLLERAGDSHGAITAYEKVLQIDPGSLLERESLGRLRAVAVQRSTTRDLFSFDDAELFDERAEDLPSTKAAAGQKADGESTFAAAAQAQAEIDAAVLRGADEHIVVPTEFSLPPSPQGAAPNGATIAASATNAVPVVTVPPLPKAAAPPKLATAAARAAVPHPSAAPGRLGTVAPATETTPEPTTVWQKLMARPSYYFRGAPLAATTLVSLGFLFWAHTQAASRDNVANTTSAPVTTTNPRVSNPASGVRPGARATNPSAATPGGGMPVNPAGGAAPAAASGTPAVAAPVAVPGAASTNPSAAVPTNPAAFAPASATAAPVAGAPAADPGATATSDGGAESTAAGAPAGSGAGTAGSSAPGTGMVDPAGSANRDFTRVAPTGGNAPPPRADAAAARAERAASSGNANAIASATRAIEAGGPDTALRYQTRAQLYMDAGDYNRAISDFQSAISGYNDMVARNDRAALARSGIATCNRGIQIARSRMAR